MLGISRSRENENTKNNHEKTSSKKTIPISPKPKILLIDLPTEVSEGLEYNGFNVTNGTFGSPYKVEVSDKFLPLRDGANLPNISEQEIIFIDLTPPRTLEQSELKKYVETEENQWWAKCSLGVIDPRLIFMFYYREDFDRILNHGGFFVIFAQPRFDKNYIWGKNERHSGLLGDMEKHNNWSFLSILNGSDFVVDYISGEEITVDGNGHAIYDFLRKNVNEAFFNVSFTAQYRLKDKWITLLRNKFGNPVGGMILSDDFKGGVLILPQIPKTPKIVHALLTEVIADLAPHLFPDLEGSKWVQRDDYELEAIKEFKNEKIKVKEEAKEQLKLLNGKIDKEREEFGFLHGILTNTGDELVEDVEKCLKFIGFNQVINVDKTIEEGKKREEDLQIHDESPILLVEIKGISNYPKDEDILQVHKYIPRRMRDWDRTDVNGVSLINYQKNIPAFERMLISQDKIGDIESHEITFISTIDLFILIRGMIKWGWDPKYIRDLFYEIGKVPSIPSNYKPIGEIFSYIKGDNILGINIGTGKLYKGQKIGYKVNNDFLEESVTSLQVESTDVEEALSGQAGIKTIYSEKILKKGTIVYEVIK